jgi:hypothetical protein
MRIILSRNFAGRRELKDIITVLKKKNCQPQTLYLEKLSSNYEDEIKTFQICEN